ncbi:MAG: hypothetical protein GXY23_12170, partial [Myxococcales bacterium]|nr:hypothetical protein [Myxococcales bacterium]
MSENDAPPKLLLTSVLDSSARPASVTRSHGDAMERLYRAMQGVTVGSIELVELPIPHKTFVLLRAHLGRPESTVALYDVFPASAKLDRELVRVAGQFLAAEAIWLLEGQGQLGSSVFDVRVDVPAGWDKSPKAIQQRLVEAGALDLGASAIEAFKKV